MLKTERRERRDEWLQEFRAIIPHQLVAAVRDPEMPFAVANKAGVLLIRIFEDDCNALY